MVTNSILQLAALTVVAFSFATSSSLKQKQPFACNMSGLSKAQRDELSASIHKLIDAKPTVVEISDGYEMKFAKAGELFPVATKWIQYERLCCPFFRFSIALDQNNGPMTVRLMGDEGVKQFIEGELPGLHTLTTGRQNPR